MSKQDLILLYGGRSAEREVSVLSAESVMRAIDYQAFSVQTYFITQSGDFIQTQAFEEKPADDEKLMTNETVDWSKKVAPSAIYKEGAVVFPVLHGPMGEDGSIQGFLEAVSYTHLARAESLVNAALSESIFHEMSFIVFPFLDMMDNFIITKI